MIYSYCTETLIYVNESIEYMSIYAIERLIKKGEETDKIIPVVLMFAPPVLIFAGTLFLVAGSEKRIYYYNEFHYYTYYEERNYMLLGLGFLLLIVGAIIGVYLLYVLISRRNAHFERTTMLYELISSYVGSPRLRDTVIRMKNEQGDEKNPVLWIVLYFLSSLVPILGLIVIIYIFHFLNKDFVKHDRNERIFLEQLSEVLPIGGVLSLSKIGRFPDRNTIVYLVLTVLTLGLFEIYWFYTLINDPNEHFREHRIIEAKIIEALKRI